MNRLKKFAMIGASLVLPTLAFAQGGSSVDSAVSTALSDGATKAGTYLVAAIAIPVAFFVFKLGKRALGRA